MPVQTIRINTSHVTHSEGNNDVVKPYYAKQLIEKIKRMEVGCKTILEGGDVPNDFMLLKEIMLTLKHTFRGGCTIARMARILQVDSTVVTCCVDKLASEGRVIRYTRHGRNWFAKI